MCPPFFVFSGPRNAAPGLCLFFDIQGWDLAKASTVTSIENAMMHRANSSALDVGKLVGAEESGLWWALVARKAWTLNLFNKSLLMTTYHEDSCSLSVRHLLTITARGFVKQISKIQ